MNKISILYSRRKIYVLLGLLSLIVFLLLPKLGMAESYQSLTDLPGFQEAANGASNGSTDSLSVMLNTIYTMAIGFGAVAAVFFLIYYGLQYATSSSGMTMSVLRNKITMVLGGVMFLIASVALLNIINPNLTGGGGGSLYDFNVAEYDTEAVEFVQDSPMEFESGTPDAWLALNKYEKVAPEEYKRLFGSEPELSRIGSDGLVTLNGEELGVKINDGQSPQITTEKYLDIFGKNPLARRINDSGKVTLNPTESNEAGDRVAQSSFGGKGGQEEKSIDELQQQKTTVPTDIQSMVSGAIKHKCPSIPKGWANSQDLLILMKKEAAKAGTPNYTISSFMKHHGISYQTYVQSVHNNKFYQDFCGTHGGVAKWKPSLPQWNQLQRNAGKRGYNDKNAGKCTSAGGIGQLNVVNMVEHYPSPPSLRGFTDPLVETCGMLSYLKKRYGHPTKALNFHKKNNWW